MILSTGARAADTLTALGDEYLKSYFAASPSTATTDGVHDYDSQVVDMSAEANAKRVAELKQFLTRFQALDAKTLKLDETIDRDLVVSQIQSDLLERETVRHFESNPDLYSSEASNTIFVLISRRFAPAATRLKAVIAREKQVPKLFAQARANLKNPPKIFTEVALEQLPGIVDFFRKDVPLALKEVKDKKLNAEFKKVNGDTIAELEKYGAWMKSDLLPRSKGDFRLGSDTFAKKLLYEEMVDLDLAALLKVGEENLRANQKALAEAVKVYDSGKPMEEVLAACEKDHPKPDQVLQTVKNLLGDLRKFIVQHKLVTIPSPLDPNVVETPPFLRALTFASMDTPGPFEKKAKEAYYNLTLPEKDWTPEHVEEHMTGYNQGVLVSTSVHEAFPGHYVQFLWLQSVQSKLRRAFGANSNDEGWAHYVEQMMLDDGYGADPKTHAKLRIGQLEDALLRNGRFMVGIGMHTGKMSYEDGIEYFMKESHLSRANAERETKRGTLDPTYLYYTLGKLEILKLREDYKQAKGSKFSLLEFHNAFLQQGFPPIKLVRRALVGNEGPVL